MTKEEILHKTVPTITFGKLIGTPKEQVFTAMESYAKQECIAFDRWKRENNYTIDYPNEQYIKLIISEDKARTEMVPVDEVYSQFIEFQRIQNINK